MKEEELPCCELVFQRIPSYAIELKEVRNKRTSYGEQNNQKREPAPPDRLENLLSQFSVLTPVRGLHLTREAWFMARCARPARLVIRRAYLKQGRLAFPRL
jgi:hypothetical protein